MSDLRIHWKDKDGNHRGLGIHTGQAHVGHLVELILANCGTDVQVTHAEPRPHWWQTAQEMGWTPPPAEEDQCLVS